MTDIRRSTYPVHPSMDPADQVSEEADAIEDFLKSRPVVRSAWQPSCQPVIEVELHSGVTFNVTLHAGEPSDDGHPHCV